MFTLLGRSLNKSLVQATRTNVFRYHFYFNPETQQIYQLTQIIAAMAIDLRIHKPRLDGLDTIAFSSPDSSSHSLGLGVTPEDIEAKRTFLGSYYLSSA